jgi:phosphomevalonate kinase
LTTRNEELLHLDQIIESSSEGSLERSEALNMKIELTEITETEMLLESLIKAYGFEDVVVVMGMESNNINVIAKSSNLTTDEAIVIYSIIAEETGTTPENVKIIPIS